MEISGYESARRIALLYLKTGGGHEAPARAIASYLEHKYPKGCTPLLFNCLENSHPFITGIVEDGYRFTQKRAKWLYSTLYELNKIKPIAYPTKVLVGQSIKSYIKDVVLPSKPDKIVVLHFFIIRPVVDLLEELGLNIKVEVIVTDPFTAHPFWFYSKVPSYILFSDRLKAFVIKKGWVEEKRIKVYPFIVSSRFEQRLSVSQKAKIKEDLTINNSKKTILLLGGGDGMPGAMSILQNMVRVGVDANVIVVCGRDEQLRLTLLNSEMNTHFSAFVVLGFVNFVYELINISDLVVTKCGPNTIMEILMCGKIPIITSYIWEQEKGNLEFVLDNKVGLYETSHRKIGRMVNLLLRNESLCNDFLSRIDRLAVSNGTNVVAEHIYSSEPILQQA